MTTTTSGSEGAPSDLAALLRSAEAAAGKNETHTLQNVERHLSSSSNQPATIHHGDNSSTAESIAKHLALTDSGKIVLHGSPL